MPNKKRPVRKAPAKRSGGPFGSVTHRGTTVQLAGVLRPTSKVDHAVLRAELPGLVAIKATPALANEGGPHDLTLRFTTRKAADLAFGHLFCENTAVNRLVDALLPDKTSFDGDGMAEMGEKVASKSKGKR